MQSLRTHKESLTPLRIAVVCLFVLIAIELTDIIVGNISDFQYDETYSFLTFFLSSETANLFYVSLITLFLIFQNLFLYYTKLNNKKENKTNRLLYVISVGFQYLLIAIILTVVFNMMGYHSYPFVLLKIAVGISFTMASIIFITLANKFLNWYKNSPNKILLIFLISFLFLSFTKLNFEFGIFSVTSYSDEIITASTTVVFPDMTENSILTFIFRDLYWAFAMVSYIGLWLGTILLVNKYREVIGLRKYYTIIIMSIVLFIPTPFGYYLSVSEIGNLIDPVLFFSLTSINSTIGAVLFFVTFWVFSKSVNHKELSKYLLITGIGMFLYFVSDQATIEQHAYPPYGLISITMLGYSAFLIYKGLLSSAILLSKDDQLRKYVYSQLNEKFLYNISLGELYGTKERIVADKVLRKNIDLITPALSIEHMDTEKVTSDIITSIMEIKEEMDLEKGFFLLLLNCIKCHKAYQIEVTQDAIVESDKNALLYPKSEEFSCNKCGNIIPLWNTKQKIF